MSNLEIKKHKLTNQNLLYKRGDHKTVATYYILDNNLNKIPDGLNIHGNTRYKVAVCQSKNII